MDIKDQLEELIKVIKPSHISQHIRANLPDLYASILKQTQFLPTDEKYSARIYCIINDIDTPPLCKTCKVNTVRYRSITEGYKSFCSRKCQCNSPSTRQKYKRTCKEHYGVENPLQSNEILEKVQKTNLGLYGHKCSLQNKDVFQRAVETCIENYGSKRPANSQIIKDKIIDTNIEKYGVDNPSKNEDIKQKIGLKSRERITKELSENGHIFCPRVGKNEQILLDAQEILDNCKIDRTFKVLGYHPDGYCHETNTIYEVYESYHLRPIQREKDIKRQSLIQKHLQCKFIIIEDF